MNEPSKELPGEGFKFTIDPADFVGKSAKETAQALLDMPLLPQSNNSGMTDVRAFFNDLQKEWLDQVQIEQALERDEDSRKGEPKEKSETIKMRHQNIMLNSILLIEALEAVAQHGTVPTATQRASLQQAADTIGCYIDDKRDYTHKGMLAINAFNQFIEENPHDPAGDPDEQVEARLGAMFDAFKKPGNLLPPEGDVNHEVNKRALAQLDMEDAAVSQVIFPMMGLIRRSLGLSKSTGRSQQQE